MDKFEINLKGPYKATCMQTSNHPPPPLKKQKQQKPMFLSNQHDSQMLQILPLCYISQLKSIPNLYKIINFKRNLRRKCTKFALIYTGHYLSLSMKSSTIIVGLQRLQRSTSVLECIHFSLKAPINTCARDRKPDIMQLPPNKYVAAARLIYGGPRKLSGSGQIKYFIMFF